MDLFLNSTSHENRKQVHTITEQGEHFGLLQIAPFYETRTLALSVFSIPSLFLTDSD